MKRHPVRSDRRGFTLVAVLAALAAAVVLSIALLHAQASAMRAAENEAAIVKARQAAQTGLAAAFAEMQSAAWAGVDGVLVREVGRDAAGVWTYRVDYLPVPGDGTPEGAIAAALRVRVRSVGAWQAFASPRPVSRTAEAVVALTPRLAGRPNRAGDTAAASDRAPDVTGYDTVQRYAVFTGDNRKCLTLNPRACVSGPVWVSGDVSLFEAPAWSGSARQRWMSSVGDAYGTAGGPTDRHPLLGPVEFASTPKKKDKDDLTRIGLTQTSPGAGAGTWSVPSGGKSLPAFDPQHYRSYRLFAGGFAYAAADVGTTLTNVSLGPTDANPLGLFFASGTLTVSNGVTVRGTLVAAGDVHVQGTAVDLGPAWGPDAAGPAGVTDANLWPRLPTIVAGGDVTFDAGCRCVVRGGVLSAQDVTAIVPNGLFSSVTQIASASTWLIASGSTNRTTAWPLYSSATLNPDPGDLYSVRFSSTGPLYAVLYPVPALPALSLRSNVNFTTFATGRICRTTLASSVWVEGPVAGKTVSFDLAADNPWKTLTGAQWDAKDAACPGAVPFVDWLGDPQNWSSWADPYKTVGLPPEPTARFALPSGLNHACEPPLFRPQPTGAGAGYRWQVATWREVAP